MADPTGCALRRFRPLRRRGDVLPAVLITAALLGGFGAAVIFLKPGRLGAAPAAMVTTHPTDAAHRDVSTTLERVIGGCHRVLAVHPRGATAFLEVLLWIEDGENPGAVDAEEILLLSYSPVMQSLTAHTIIDTPEAGVPGPYHPSELARPRFCDAWRRDARGHARVIASGLSDMRVERVTPAPEAPHAAGLLEIRLTWGEQSSDQRDEAVVYVEVAARPLTDEE